MPETRLRTSATRVGAMRPGSSRTTARGCDFTVMIPTSGSALVAANAGVASSQPASIGARPAITNAARAARAKIPFIK
jgi:hypothetical protein